jgi:hypothetical protein
LKTLITNSNNNIKSTLGTKSSDNRELLVSLKTSTIF